MPFMSLIQHLRIRARPRLFDQVGHETMYASSQGGASVAVLDLVEISIFH